MMKQVIPINAESIKFWSMNNKYGEIFVWPGEDGKLWYWSCMGNNGQEKDKISAVQEAKRWIRD